MPSAVCPGPSTEAADCISDRLEAIRGIHDVSPLGGPFQKDVLLVSHQRFDLGFI